MVAATSGPSYLRSIPSLPERLLAVEHERLPHKHRLREQQLLAELKWRIREARTNHELLHGPIDVEEPTWPDDR